MAAHGQEGWHSGKRWSASGRLMLRQTSANPARMRWSDITSGCQRQAGATAWSKDMTARPPSIAWNETMTTPPSGIRSAQDSSTPGTRSGGTWIRLKRASTPART